MFRSDDVLDSLHGVQYLTALAGPLGFHQLPPDEGFSPKIRFLRVSDCISGADYHSDELILPRYFRIQWITSCVGSVISALYLIWVI